MVLKSLNDLKGIVAGEPRKRMVVAAAQDQHSLGAVIKGWKENIVDPILVGDKEKIQNICAENNYDITGLRIIHEPDIQMAVEIAVKLVNNGQGDILMKGKVGTSILLKEVLNKEWGLRTGKLLSHFALFEVETYHKVIAVTDVAMNIAPNLQAKIAIINNSVGCLIKLGYIMPKVAVL
ncbi:MAG TPA: phosphate acyltransferase, partial [Bacteroidales bacterium]|nr:phosphate acyltransferase [Bacteroidales bacterium]